MPRNEDITRRELINPKIHARGWTEDLIRPERTVGQVEIIAGRPRRGSSDQPRRNRPGAPEDRSQA